MKDLEKLRDEIDQIDRQMQQLFEERMKVSAGVAAFKAQTGKPVLDPEREKALLDKLAGRASDEEMAEGIVKLYTTLLEISRDYQSKRV
ncbi:MAG: chorismate mutase [Lachnospiraceae bacterium]|nr:chorismate mutase [Candidatus Equihabitans merdae]